MKTRRIPKALGHCLIAGVAAGVVSTGASAETFKYKKHQEFTDEFPIRACDDAEGFENTVGNSRFILTPGRILEFSNGSCYEEGECEELEAVEISVLNETRDVTFDPDGDGDITISARIVQEYETSDGDVTEISLNYFAACGGDVYYFGEAVCDSDGPECEPQDDGPGAWLAGQFDAQPGIIMPGGAFVLGARYYQETAELNGALDRAEHTDMGVEVGVEAGDFEDCVEISETTPLDAHELSEKIYCDGVGLVVDDDLELDNIIDP